VGRILGLDYGRRRTGVAISDPLGVTAQPCTTWSGLCWNDVVEKVLTLIAEMEVERVVVGLPLGLSGKRGRMAREVERFTEHLKQRIGIPVTLWDERLTSTQARRVIHEIEEKPSRSKEKVDLIASVLLLQNYLDHQKGAMLNRREEKG
jgi:putative Holliday junction resolvase